jgi:hypothetical protein
MTFELVRKGLTEAGKRADQFSEELGKKQTRTASSNTNLRFPLNIESFPTYMQYTAYEFTPTGTMATKNTAFGNVGAVENVLATIYLPALKSDVSEGQGWGTDSANSIAAGAATAGLTAFKEANGGVAGVAAAGLAGAGAATKASSATLVTGAAGLVSSGRGFGVMEQQSLKYEGPEIRGLTCTYNFVPRSHNEVLAISDIIGTFRYHSAPGQSNIGTATGVGLDAVGDFNTGVRSYKFPSLFKIRWLDQDAEDNVWLPKYNTCYCESVAVEYGDEKFTTFHQSSGAPTTYTLTLTFKELDYVTKQRIEEEGFGG